MNHKRLWISIALFIVLGLIGFNAAASAISAQSQPAATPAPGRPVAPRFPLPQALVADVAALNPAPTAYTNYVRLTDDSDFLSIEIPAEWSDVETDRWVVRGQDIGIYIAAAPDLSQFYDSHSQPGVFFGASIVLVGNQRVANGALTTHPALRQLLSDEKASRRGQCQDGGRFSYQDNFYLGNYDLYLKCQSGSPSQIVLVSMPPSQQYLTLLRIHITSEADLDAASHIFESYQVLNSSLEDDD